jgi:transposase
MNLEVWEMLWNYLGKDARAIAIRSTIRLLKMYLSEIDIIEAEILLLLDKKGINTAALDELPTKDSLIDNLKTIPGVSDKTIAAVISECGDLTRFPSIPKFIGYLGLFPTENSSGNSKSIGHLSFKITYNIYP